MRTVALAVVAAAVTVTALAGCGGAAAQGAPAPTHGTAEETPAHRPPPSTPQTKDGAVEFLYAYVAERERAFLTNDDSTLLTYTRPSCSCATVTSKELARRRAEGLIAASDAGPHITRIGRWEERGAQRKIGLEIAHRPTSVMDRGGKAVGQDNALIERELFTLSYQSGRWIIDQTSGYSKSAPR